jgi:hypothetical protein
MLNVLNINTFIYTDKRLINADSDNRQTRPLVREGAPQKDNSNRQTVTNI